MNAPTNARELLTALGIGQFNATMVIQYMFIAPATTDPKSPSVMMLVKAIQNRLALLGYAVPQAGYLDRQTANAIESVAGAGWESRMWADTVKVVLAAPRATRARVLPIARSMSGLPDVPGGKLTYAAAAAAAAYYFLIHKKRR